jgi:hypothetical protein
VQFKNKRWADIGRLSLGSLLIAVVLFLNLLAAAPSLHQWFHADAAEAQHHCAVMLFEQGQVDVADVALDSPVPSVAVEFFPSILVSVPRVVLENLPPGRAPPSASHIS